MADGFSLEGKNNINDFLKSYWKIKRNSVYYYLGRHSAIGRATES